jgi:hypothetical protein
VSLFSDYARRDARCECDDAAFGIFKTARSFTMINVAFNGEKLFEWEGDADAVARMDEAVLRIADLADASPSDLSQTTIGGISRNGGFSTSNPEAEMMIVLWTLISMPTNYPDHPGFIRDYIEVWDFDFDVTSDPVNEHQFTIAFNAAFAKEGAA